MAQEPRSKMWSCSTFCEGVAHIQAEADDAKLLMDEEAALLFERFSIQGCYYVLPFVHVPCPIPARSWSLVWDRPDEVCRVHMMHACLPAVRQAKPPAPPSLRDHEEETLPVLQLHLRWEVLLCL